MSDTNTFAGEGPGASPHLTREFSADSNEQGNTLVLPFEGTRAELFEKLKGSEFFKQWNGEGADAFPSGGSTTSGTGYSIPYLSRVRIRRTRGPVCLAEFVINQVRVRGIWGLDFAEISKPILAWYRPGTPPEDDDENNRPSGQKIREWMKLGNDNPASPDYNGFMINGEKLEGATLTLAQMIYRGVESFSVWVPVATWQCRVFDPPDISLYPVGNQISELAAPHGIMELGDKDFLSHMNGLTSRWSGEPWIWVRTASRVATNPDGTYIWTMQFTAAEKADEDLYPKEN